MKNFIKEYLNIIAYSILGFIFVLTSFYFLINYYHYDELKSRIYLGETDNKIVRYRDTVDQIKVNLNKYSSKKNNNIYYQQLYQELSTCYFTMTQPGTYYTIETNRFLSPIDVYLLGGKFQTDNLNNCWALHLSSIKSEEKNEKIKTVAPFVANEVNVISKQTQMALDELLNNSSYFLTTKISSITVRNYLSSDYNVITTSYQDFADLILDLSKLLNEGGNNA